MKLKIQVTERDIRLGKPGDGESCPIARAMTRAGYKPEAAYLWLYAICPKTGKTYSMRTPRELFKFMKRFDNYRTVEPFNAELEMEEKK